MKKGELIPTRVSLCWRMHIDYRKLNGATRKDHFPLPFIDQILERVAGYPYYCFLDGYSGYYQILIAIKDQEKIIFTCPSGTCTDTDIHCILSHCCSQSFNCLQEKLSSTGYGPSQESWSRLLKNLYE
ncbi:hypothetical protein ACOSQ4_005390 [Xanthoceras sorbifolium]